MDSTKLIFMVAVLLLHYCVARARKRRFDESDISNEVLVEFVRIPRFPGFRRTDYLIESNLIPEARVLVPAEVKNEISKRLRKDGYDPYYLKDLHLLIPSRSLDGDRFIDVTLDRGVIVGTSDFHSIDELKEPSKDYFQLLLVWNHLEVQYRVTVDRGGLKNDGEIDLDIGRLLMDIQMHNSHSRSPSIQMSKVTEVKKTKLTGFDSLLEEFRAAMCLEVETEVKSILNNEIRNILLKYAKEVLSSDSSDENDVLSPKYNYPF